MKALSWIEFFLIGGIVAMFGLIVTPVFERHAAAERRTSCAMNLKQLGLAMKMYANESPGERYPPASPIPNNWIPDPAALYPKYLRSLDFYMCPANPEAGPDAFHLKDTANHPSAAPGQPHRDCVSSRFYIYTGFLIGDDIDAIAVFDSAQAAVWEFFRNNDLKPPLPYGLDRYNQGGGGAIMWDRVPPDPRAMAHGGAGGNVLFLDGHVEFIEYHHSNPMEMFPMTRVSGQTFGSATPQLSPDCLHP